MDINTEEKQGRFFIDLKTVMPDEPKTREEIEKQRMKEYFKKEMCEFEGLTEDEFYERYGY